MDLDKGGAVNNGDDFPVLPPEHPIIVGDSDVNEEVSMSVGGHLLLLLVSVVIISVLIYWCCGEAIEKKYDEINRARTRARRMLTVETEMPRSTGSVYGRETGYQRL
eukprot:GHVO01044865.1.p1 GENE.GHVO01044865.1~~GHVO01044865.1.p1  ORF type:complete len:107 (-),score=21.43 GHVO01044865.1:145-465(-)